MVSMVTSWHLHGQKLRQISYELALQGLCEFRPRIFAEKTFLTLNMRGKDDSRLVSFVIGDKSEKVQKILFLQKA